MSSSSSSSSKKRHRIEAEEEDGEEEVGDFTNGGNLSTIPVEKPFDAELAKIVVNEKEKMRFATMPAEAQKTCIKTIYRLFIFKGTKGEHIPRTVIGDLLGKIDPDYKKFINSVLEKVQELLSETAGYQIVPGHAIFGATDGKKEDYYLYNAFALTVGQATGGEIRSLLSKAANVYEQSYRGFIFLVFHILMKSGGNRSPLGDILRDLRRLDGRFTETMIEPQRGASTAHSVPAIRELEENFLGLMGRMRKDHYVVATKDEQDPSDVSKTIYAFGPRFHLEVGKKALMLSYFQLVGQPIDEQQMRAIEKELNKGREEAGGEEKTAAEAPPQGSSSSASASPCASASASASAAAPAPPSTRATRGGGKG